MSATASLADEKQLDSAFLFVYGALMQGCYLHHCLTGASFIGKGWTSGTLVALGRYPGLVEGNGKVAGELYRLDDPAAALEVLDDVEDFDPGDPEASIYLRVLRDVRMLDHSTVRAWTYVYNRDVADVPIVSSGDWRAHQASGRSR